MAPEQCLYDLNLLAEQQHQPNEQSQHGVVGISAHDSQISPVGSGLGAPKPQAPQPGSEKLCIQSLHSCRNDIKDASAPNRNTEDKHVMDKSKLQCKSVIRNVFPKTKAANSTNINELNPLWFCTLYLRVNP
jgi:hypothetical protein